MSRILGAIICLCVFGLMRFSAQQNILLNQSAYNPYVLNSAAIGLYDDITANCHYKKNWFGLSESPELVQLTVDGPFSKGKYAAGLNLINEKAGIFSKTYLSGSFRFRAKLSQQHQLLFGLSAGFQRQLSDFSKIKADAPEEFQQWPQQQAVTIPDAAFGLAYSYKKWLAGVSVTQLLQQNYIYSEPVYNKQLQYKTVSHFIFFIQNTFTLQKDRWYYSPNLIVRSPQGLPAQIDILNTIHFKNLLLFGVGYRHRYALYGNLGFNITEKLRVIYSYEYALGIQKITKGGHEIGIRFGLVNKTVKASAPPKLESSEMEEIQQKLDQHQQEIEAMHKRMDSLDKNVSRLKMELDILKENQVKQEEVEKAIEKYYSKTKTDSLQRTNSKDNSGNRVDQPGKYKVISPKSDSDFETSEEQTNSNYKIVLGVYQVLPYAKEFQKLVRRELGLETKLIQLPDHPKKYIYVCKTREFSNLKEAIGELKKTRKETKSKDIEVVKGEAWILQTIND